MSIDVTDSHNNNSKLKSTGTLKDDSNNIFKMENSKESLLASGSGTVVGH